MQTFMGIANQIKTTLNNINSNLNDVKSSLNEIKTTLNNVNASLNEIKTSTSLCTQWKINCLEYGQSYVSGFDIITHIKSQLQEGS